MGDTVTLEIIVMGLGFILGGITSYLTLISLISKRIISAKKELKEWGDLKYTDKVSLESINISLATIQKDIKNIFIELHKIKSY